MLTGWLSNEVGLGLLRNVLLGVGASLVTQGIISQGNLNDIVGALVIIAGVVMSALANRSKANANAIVKAVEAHPSLTVIPAAETTTGKPKVIVRAPQPVSGGLAQANVR